MEETLCIWGDSITWGAWDKQHNGWPVRVGLKLNRDEYVVYPLGIPGDMTRGVLERFPVEAYVRDPTQIIFAIGVNDLCVNQKGKQWSSPAQFVANITALIKLAKQYTKKIAFLELTYFNEKMTQPIPWDIEASYANKERDKFNLLLKQTAKKNNVAFIPVTITNNDLSDGLHPNEKGHEKIAKTVLTFLKKNKWIT